jgi:hypothetical protein
MNSEQMLWSTLTSAMIPVAKRAISLLTDKEKTGTPASPGVTGDAALPADYLSKLEHSLQSATGTAAPPSILAAAAFSEGEDEVFRRAHQRVAWYFRLHFVMAIGLIVIFLGGAAGTVISGIVGGVSIWSAVFGSLSVASAFGLFVARPLQMVREAVVTSTRLELLQFRWTQLAKDCAALPALKKQMQCRSDAWETAIKELTAILKG